MGDVDAMVESFDASLGRELIYRSADRNAPDVALFTAGPGAPVLEGRTTKHPDGDAA